MSAYHLTDLLRQLESDRPALIRVCCAGLEWRLDQPLTLAERRALEDVLITLRAWIGERSGPCIVAALNAGERAARINSAVAYAAYRASQVVSNAEDTTGARLRATACLVNLAADQEPALLGALSDALAREVQPELAISAA